MDTTREGSTVKRILQYGCELSRRKRGKIRKLICRLKKTNFFSPIFVFSLIKSNLLTADPRLSEHPPKQDVDFLICCGR